METDRDTVPERHEQAPASREHPEMDTDRDTVPEPHEPPPDPGMGMRRGAGPRQSETARKLLGIYLADHHAGSVAGLELARRAAGHNAGTPIGIVLHDVVAEIAADKRTLEQLMQALDVETSPAKRAMAFLTERFARLKANGRLFAYSPLSRVVELESLALGILGKRKLWEGLERVPALDGVAGLDFAGLAERARSQHAAVEECRRQAVDVAFGA